MSKVAVIYWSGTGHTEAMANAVAEGAKSAGAEADVLFWGDVSSVDGYDAVAYKIRWDSSGNEIRRELLCKSAYRAKSQVVAYGA